MSSPPGTLPGSPVVKTVLPLQWARVRSLAGELRSHVACDTAKKKKKPKNNLFLKTSVCQEVSPSQNEGYWKGIMSGLTFSLVPCVRSSLGTRPLPLTVFMWSQELLQT